MTEKILHIPLEGEPYYPKLVVKIDKTKEFKYSISLCILKEGDTIMLCHCDNYHGKGDHIHFCYSNGKKEEPFKFKGFDQTIEYFKNNWEEIKGKIENGN